MKKRLKILEDEMLRREEYDGVLRQIMQSVVDLIKSKAHSKCDGENIYITYCSSKSIIVISTFSPSNNYINNFDGCDKYSFHFHDEKECKRFSEDVHAWLKKAFPQCRIISSFIKIKELQPEEVSFVFHYYINKSSLYWIQWAFSIQIYLSF